MRSSCLVARRWQTGIQRGVCRTSPCPANSAISTRSMEQRCRTHCIDELPNEAGLRVVTTSLTQRRLDLVRALENEQLVKVDDRVALWDAEEHVESSHEALEKVLVRVLRGKDAHLMSSEEIQDVDGICITLSESVERHRHHLRSVDVQRTHARRMRRLRDLKRLSDGPASTTGIPSDPSSRSFSRYSSTKSRSPRRSECHPAKGGSSVTARNLVRWTHPRMLGS